MADNVPITPGVGATVAADDIAGVLHQRVKVTWGVDGAAVDASATDPLPVTTTKLPATLGSKADSASLAVTQSTEDKAALAAQATLLTDIDTLLSNIDTRQAGWDTEGVAGTVESATASDNGLTKSRVKSAASNNLTSLKATPGRIYDIDVSNTTASLKYLKLYNKASAPVVASDTPSRTIPLPANGGGYSKHFPLGIYFSTGIAYAITGAVGDTDATNTAVDDVTGAIQWI